MAPRFFAHQLDVVAQLDDGLGDCMRLRRDVFEAPHSFVNVSNTSGDS